MGSVATPEIERSFGASHALATAMLFLVPGIVALVVEPWLFVLADRYPRRWFVRGGVAAMAVASVVAACAEGPVAMAGSQALLWCAIGSASSLAQATLVDASEEKARTIARWTLLSLAGDLAAPLLLAGLAISGFGWRMGYAVTAAMLAAWAIAMVVSPDVVPAVGVVPDSDVVPDAPAAPDREQTVTGNGSGDGDGVPPDSDVVPNAPATPEQTVTGNGSGDGDGVTLGLFAAAAPADPDVVPDAPAARKQTVTGNGSGDGDGVTLGLFAALREAVSDRTLMIWLFATALCDLMDEILIVLASIRVRDDFGASATWQTVTIVAFVAGDVTGLITLDRLLKKMPELTVLAFAAAGCAIAYAAWLLAPTPLWSACLFAPVGLFVAPLYPIASAQAYAQRPDRSGLVLAASHLFTPLGLALPFLLGLAADRIGVRAALAMLLVQPVGLAVLAARRLRAR